MSLKAVNIALCWGAGFAGCPTNQIFVDVDWLLEDGPYDCFVAVGRCQGAHVAKVLCAVNISNQVIYREGRVYGSLSVYGKRGKKNCQSSECRHVDLNAPK